MVNPFLLHWTDTYALLNTSSSGEPFLTALDWYLRFSELIFQGWTLLYCIRLILTLIEHIFQRWTLLNCIRLILTLCWTHLPGVNPFLLQTPMETERQSEVEQQIDKCRSCRKIHPHSIGRWSFLLEPKTITNCSCGYKRLYILVLLSNKSVITLYNACMLAIIESFKVTQTYNNKKRWPIIPYSMFWPFENLCHHPMIINCIHPYITLFVYLLLHFYLLSLSYFDFTFEFLLGCRFIIFPICF